jgi:hypothetical protein
MHAKKNIGQVDLWTVEMVVPETSVAHYHSRMLNKCQLHRSGTLRSRKITYLHISFLLMRATCSTHIILFLMIIRIILF